ncbi:MraY family glycosyltransferase [Methylomonas rapida]|uniref:Glycosyltransferase family 4 protein n=1 Tax=Methylomonas rapida TaxID=2963939 RepID=A0ABY7GET7_9GAMM|nr:glycosyltransferase family 4 protein [Methylomonas rapida]WAR43800.1 glycosyltransferase family 4 protein [Methylomonas rapida]
MLLLFIGVLLVAVVLTGLIRFYALSNQVLDIPNQRSSHTVPTPRGGGLAVVLAFTFAMLILFLKGLADDDVLSALSGALLVAGIGFMDDHGHVPARWRFLIHLLASGLAVGFLHGFPLLLLPAPVDVLMQRGMIDLGWFGYTLGVLLLVWFLNLFNFMDGIDGIAASESVFVSGALAGYLYYLDRFSFLVAICLVAASLGFLLWNWPKAKIFMGDVGSGFLGLMLGILILMAAKQAAVLLYCGLILFGIFIVDASYTLGFRFFSGQKWYDAHCSHAYQHAAKRYGHLRVLQASWALNLLWLLPISWLIFIQPRFALLGLIVAYLPLLYLAYRFEAGRQDRVA